jgi:hypothetical protein
MKLPRAMGRWFALLLLLWGPAIMASASEVSTPQDGATRSYLAVHHFPGIKALPLVLERHLRDKDLTVIGTRHVSNPESPMYRTIAATLDAKHPELILHEGDAPPDLGLGTASNAVRRAADLGFIAQYARQHGISFRSADAPVHAEIVDLLAQHTARDVFVFLTAQRLIGSTSHPDLAAAASAYPAFVTDYLERNGLPIDPTWREWQGFLSAYKALMGRPLETGSWSGRQFDPTLTGSPLNELARASDQIRDQWLLKTIRAALQEHDRVVVQFGLYHVLAIEPALPK